MACPSDPEEQRPKNFVEAISSDHSWDTYGIRIKWTDPVVPGNIKPPVNEAVKLRVCVEIKNGFPILPHSLTAWCWTHIRSQDNPCGIWREIKLDHNPSCTQKDDQGNVSYVFQSSVVPTANDLYRLTFNVKYEKVMIWVNYFQVDNMVDVQKSPSGATKSPQASGRASPSVWKSALSSIMPQTCPLYSHYFSSLFTDKKDREQSTSAHGPRDGKKKKSDNDDIEVVIRL